LIRKEIACWDFDYYQDEKELLGVATMKDAYQRAGIGEEMLKVAESLHEDFLVAKHFT
jgi:hypothetical protein